jgi:hypothetical protein
MHPVLLKYIFRAHFHVLNQILYYIMMKVALNVILPF